MHKLLAVAAVAFSIPIASPSPVTAKQAEVIQNAMAAADISATEMREDILELASNIKSNHPRPFRIITEEDFDALIAEKVASLDEDATRSDLLWAMSEILTSIGCAHSQMPFFGQEDALIDVAERFPMDVRMHEGRLFVMDPLSNSEHIEKGREIVSINGIPVPELREEIFAHIASDVNLPNFKGPMFNTWATSYLTYALDFPATYQVKLRGDSDAVVLTQLKEFKFKPIVNPSSDCQDRLCYNVDEATNIGVMTIRSFDYYGAEGQKFVDFTKTVFDDLEKHQRPGLLIDTRGVLGGSGLVGSYLLRHLADKPFDYYDPATADRRGSEGMFRPQLPIETKFNGPAFLLMDGMTVSAIPHFYALAKENGIATLIGEPAGGGKSTNDGKVQLSASNSETKYAVARMRFDVAAPSLSINDAVLPDIRLSYSLEDILDRTDSMVPIALKLLATKAGKAAQAENEGASSDEGT